MWTIIKYDKKNLSVLEYELKRKTNDNLKIYIPKICIQIFHKNKISNKEINIIGDYMFCFHEKFKNKNFYNIIKYTKGLKLILNGCDKAQEEIQNFITKCQNSENEKGFISKNFYEIILNSNYKFLSGIFINKIFKIIELQKNCIKILIGKKKIIINKDNNLFSPVN